MQRKLWLDAVPFVHTLEYGAGLETVVLGKPTPEYFLSATADMGCRPEHALMIGADVRADVLGAMAVGMQACPPRAGKYSSQDEADLQGTGGLVCDDLSALVATHL